MAITSVTYQPASYMSVHNPIMWSVMSDKIHMCDFKYVFDIRINADIGISPDAVQYFVKVLPNSVGSGMIDIQPFVQGNIDYSTFSAEEGTILPYKNGVGIATWCRLRVGEEYRLGPTASLISYSGFLDIPGPPSYSLYSDIGRLVFVISSALSPSDQVKLLTYGGTSSFLSEYACIGPESYYPKSIIGKFLKRDTNIIEVGLNDRHTLGHFAWGYDYNGDNWYTSRYQINYYDSTNVLLNTMTFSALSLSALPNDYKNIMNTFRCGPKDLSIGSQPYSYYEVFAKGYTAGSPFDPGVTASEVVRFNIIDYCEDLYPKIRLSFLNSLGGRDYYNFTMFYEQSSNSTERNYNQTTMNWNQATPVVIPTALNDSSSNWRIGGNKSFNKNVTRRFTIQSDYLDQEKVDFLSGIPESPSVWAYIGTQSVPYTVTVTNTEYTNKYVKQQKLVQVSFDCTLTKTQQKQNS